jgi:hypothetical protein
LQIKYFFGERLTWFFVFGYFVPEKIKLGICFLKNMVTLKYKYLI